MRIELTPEQYAEFDNPFYDITYTYTVNIDGVDVDFEGNVNEDDYRSIIAYPLITDVAPQYASVDANGDPVGDPIIWAMAHPALTWEDEVVLKHVLDERAAFTQTVNDAAQVDRAGLRSAERTRLRQEARTDGRRTARREARIAGRQAERQLLRQQHRQEAAIAAKIEARRLELEPESV